MSNTPPAEADGVDPARGGAQATDPVEQARLIRALCEPGALTQGAVRVIETHISYVLLTGSHAYKIKKAVALPFLDFRTLPARRRFCEEELRLNGRLAPNVYLDVVAITGTVASPRVDGGGDILEYAVRMREFPQQALLSRVLERGELTPSHIDALAAEVAQFHARALRADGGFAGEPLAAALANFDALEALETTQGERVELLALRRWTEMEYAACRDALEQRARDGSIRECHGDLHLGNIALVDGRITIFDCIEFDPALRWIDTMSEIAFTAMDLDYRAQPELARRFVNAYLEHTGDYGGARVLRFFLAYRALVRAKVARLRAAQLPQDARRADGADAAAHERLAASYAFAAHPALVVMRGPSGCGKTAVSQVLLERTGAARVRTDVERKRLAGLGSAARSGSPLAGGLYEPGVTERTYRHVLDCARSILQGGFIALVDGTFLRRGQRDAFRDLAAELRVPFAVADCSASTATLEARVLARARTGHDASEADLAVLAQQLRTAEPLAPEERAFAFSLDTEAPLAEIPAQDSWRALVQRVAAPEAR
jgi:aminoglycoside phosphotransferase family enzyme/predicted kinase